jgi:protein-disulfide isomerase
VFKHLPLPSHPEALPAAKAALEAQAQGRFWPYHDLLFAHQSELTRENLLGWARGLGLEVEHFKRALDEDTHHDRLAADQELGRKLGVRGAPIFFINGHMFKGAKPYEKFKKKVDEEMQRADQLLESGVSRERLYQELTQPPAVP